MKIHVDKRWGLMVHSTSNNSLRCRMYHMFKLIRFSSIFMISHIIHDTWYMMCITLSHQFALIAQFSAVNVKQLRNEKNTRGLMGNVAFFSRRSMFSQLTEFMRRRRRPASSSTPPTWWWNWGTRPGSPAGQKAARRWPSSGCGMATLSTRQRRTERCSPACCRTGVSSSWA